MPTQVQPLGQYERQFRELMAGAIDPRKFVDATTGPIDTNFEVRHGLGRVPVGYVVIKRSAAVDIYNDDSDEQWAWTNEVIYLCATVFQVNIRLLIF